MAKVSHKGRQVKSAVDGSGVSGGSPTGPAMIPPTVYGGNYKSYPPQSGAAELNGVNAYAPGTLLSNRRTQGQFKVGDAAMVSSDRGGAAGVKSGQDYKK